MKHSESFCLNILASTFKTYDVDWLNYKITKNNPLQYHHRVFKSNGGLTTLENGVLLTNDSHLYFHTIYRKDFITAKQITREFKILSETNMPPTKEYYEHILYYVEKYEKKRIRVYVK